MLGVMCLVGAGVYAMFLPKIHAAASKYVDGGSENRIAQRAAEYAEKDAQYDVQYQKFTSCLEAQKPLWQNYVDTCRNTKNVEESATSLESITNVRNKILQELSCELKVGKAWECRKAESSDLYVPRWP